MRVFLDFEASSLRQDSYPIEVGWIDEAGEGESHLIRPEPHWTDWDPAAEAVHGITRGELEGAGEAACDVAGRMLVLLADREFYASAPSWDGKWLSVLLRAAGLPRHALRLADSETAHLAAARAALRQRLRDPSLEDAAAAVVAEAHDLCQGPVAHRALADAKRERDIWLTVQRLAVERAALR
jgi:hypothetical protein